MRQLPQASKRLRCATGGCVPSPQYARVRHGLKRYCGRIDYPGQLRTLSCVDRMVSAMTKKEELDLRRIHHSPLFWVGAVLFLAAIAIYIFSDDLSWRPSAR